MAASLRHARDRVATHTCVVAVPPAGNNEAAQLDHIFKLMGRPSEETWPEVTQLSL